ncbi:tetratricopeptide repeat protein [Fimbriimonas ginsengisoli]|uniref:Putative tetratricopeptide repeat-containing domain protein n=1 Tax=Fimbriimonas ginsengisoli Gsoil 348 TaxID=661478 RepID=A0A068NY73_FIMGI|nr:tetratricopeptide repeat protein [Fimbriimonas ginsengisoli]AIE87900.1 putative tetratricopeptide repeat-containing domain protein [Fimbriimonas ginsengisoli Gsoil 348]
MEPNYKTIADLFAVVQPTDLTVDEKPRPKEGKTAEESDALGRQSLADGDPDAAVRHFKRAVEQREATDIASRVDLAGALDYADQAPQALRQYQLALRAKSDAVEPVVGMSEIYKRYGRFRDAIEKLESAVAKEPSNPYLRIKLAETLRDAGQPKRALAAAQEAVMLKPDDAFYHYWIGDLLITMGQYDGALDSLRAAIELSPGDDHLYVRAAVAFWRAGRQVEAVKAVRLASDLDPSKHLYHGLLGILLEESDLAEEAKLESNRADKMDRYDHDLLGRLLDEMGIEA